MFLEAFTDELVNHRTTLVKVAAFKLDKKLLGRLAAAGSLIGLVGHAGGHLKAKITGDPYSAPPGTALGAAARYGTAGLATGGIIQALSRMGARR